MATPAQIRALAEGRNILDGTPGGIEASEKLGQVQLVRSTNMPLELKAAGRPWSQDGKPDFEAVGFTFGDALDECFQAATLPEGWTRAASSHSMWSYILDAKGRRRVGVFYKAAFYDRRASANLHARYSAGLVYSDDGTRPTEAAIVDCGQPIERFPVETLGNYQSEEAAAKKAAEALAAKFPDWTNALAYWD